jgi:AAA ATPase domain
MKLSKLNIQSLHHLENLNFDFTYPKTHELAGQPLKKICIIGQSATGKTSILELIKETFNSLNETEIYKDTSNYLRFHSNIKGLIKFNSKNSTILIENDKLIYNDIEINSASRIVGDVEKLIIEDLKLLYFSSELISKEAIIILNENPINLLLNLNLNDLELNQTSFVYEFNQNVNNNIWFSMVSKILGYRKRFTQMASELINKGAIGDIQKLNTEYNNWSKNNENPIISFASIFDPILKKLNLKVDAVNTEYIIPIQSTITESVIPITALSTGTKSLLLSLFPLFELNTKDSLILLDEPERSLFPDMQIDLIAHYSKIAPDAQLIVATHSPFIAAAFEPEERFILYFDKEGKVALRQGESPIGDDPNDMLKNDFNIDYYNEFGKKAYSKYCELKLKIKNEKELSKKEELISEIELLGDKYNF